MFAIRWDQIRDDDIVRAVACLSEGMLRCGDSPELIHSLHDDPKDSNVVVTFSANKPYHNQITLFGKTGFRRRLVLNWGAMHRGYHWQLGWDGIGGRADFMNEDVDSSRAHIFGSQALPWRQPQEDDPVVVVGQVPYDGALRQTDIVSWCVKAVRDIKASGLPVVVRPHPQAPGSILEETVGVPLVTRPLKEMRARCVVTYNSTTASLSALYGTPVVALDRGSLAWEVAGHSLEDIADPPRPDRTRWVEKLGFTQWSEDELRSGEAWSHLRDGAPEPSSRPWWW